MGSVFAKLKVKCQICTRASDDSKFTSLIKKTGDITSSQRDTMKQISHEGIMRFFIVHDTLKFQQTMYLLLV